MVNKIVEYIHKHHMLEKGDIVIVGVSGGADSVCLLSVLYKLQPAWELKLVVAHVNHMYRETAQRDENYVKKLCREWNLEYKGLCKDVKAVAEEKGISFEEAGRQVRYEFFDELKKQYKADKIAVAHHREDCSETMLFHLFRGSNIKGLGGIAPVNGDIIRPLMNVNRNEIENYLVANTIEWMEDETNASVAFSRNSIRHEIMPGAEQICTGACDKIAETAEELRLVEDYLAIQTDNAYRSCCEMKDEGVFIRISALQELHPVLKSRVLYKALEKQAGMAKDLGRIHVRELENLCELQSGRSIDLPYEIRAYRTFDGIFVGKRFYETDSEATLLSATDLEAGLETEIDLPKLGRVRARLLFDCKLENIPQKTYTKWFDYDKITKCPVFRKRKEGDYLTIDDGGSHKKLKEYFIQEKIPAYKRDDIWILADESHVMWVPGHRISSFYKVTEETGRVLEITIGG